jgi:hypothetical protein
MYLYSKAPVTAAEIDALTNEVKAAVSQIAKLGSDLPERWFNREKEQLKAPDRPPIGILSLGTGSPPENDKPPTQGEG